MNDAPKEIWVTYDHDIPTMEMACADGQWFGVEQTHYTRTDTIPTWSDDMDAAPRDVNLYAWNGMIEHYAYLFDTEWMRVNHHGDHEPMDPQPTHWKHIDTPTQKERK